MEPKKRRILGFALLILLVLVFLLWNQVLPDMFPERAEKTDTPVLPTTGMADAIAMTISKRTQLT